MKLLLTIRNQDINPQSPVINNKNFKVREASRAVVMNDKGECVLLKVGLHNYHKLPGGGVESGEDVLIALRRELLEEIGCKVTVIAEVGTIIEYRDEFKLKQTSHCFLAKQVGSQVPSSLEQEEIAENFKEVKVSDIDSAIKLLEQDIPNNYEGEFIKIRDLEFLKIAKILVDEKDF